MLIQKKWKPKNRKKQKKKQSTQFLYQAIIIAEVGQYVQINLFDEDKGSSNEILGR